MASSSSSSSSAVAVYSNDTRVTVTSCHNDAAMLSQSRCSRTSTSSERHNNTTSSSADGGLTSLHVISDVISVTSEDNYASFVSAVVSFMKVIYQQLSASLCQCRRVVYQGDISVVVCVSMLALHSGIDPGIWGWGFTWNPWIYVGRSEYVLIPQNVTFLRSKLWLDNCKFHIIKDERLVSKMEGKTNVLGIWNSLMAWPDWSWPHPHILRQIYATVSSSLSVSLNMQVTWPV